MYNSRAGVFSNKLAKSMIMGLVVGLVLNLQANILPPTITMLYNGMFIKRHKIVGMIRQLLYDKDGRLGSHI